MLALGQIRGVIRALQTSTMKLFARIVSFVNCKTLNILSLKTSIFDSVNCLSISRILTLLWWRFLSRILSIYCSSKTLLQSLSKKCPYAEFLWSAFSCIRTKYGNLRSKSPYSVRMRENTDQKKLRIRTLLTQCTFTQMRLKYRNFLWATSYLRHSKLHFFCIVVGNSFAKS